jgi:GPH family glycoside/pentoside/hexuronide:cation symporter
MGTGFFVIALVIGILYALSTWLLYKTTDGLDPDTTHAEFQEKNDGPGFVEMIKTGLKNKYSTMVMLSYIVYMLLSGLMGGTLIYYFRYYVGNENLMSVYSPAIMAGMVVAIVTMRFITKRFGNAMSCIIGGVICLIAFIPRIITKDGNTAVFAVCIALMGLGSGYLSQLIHQCKNDAATYGKLHGQDNASVIISLFTFAQKLGQAISSVVAAGLLAIFHYTPGDVPDPTVVKLFFAENITIPMVIAVIDILLLSVVYKMEKQMMKDLAAQKAE